MRDDLVLLPVGAVEAHGPHLPLDTDTRIAVLLAERVAAAFPGAARVAPPFTETACSYAADFPGTVHVAGDVERRLLSERISSLLETSQRVVLVNLHFDPEHVAAVKDVVASANSSFPGRVLFPNFTRRAHAQAIGGEFATGACHGGEFETSLMLVAAPTLVGDHNRLPPLEVDLAKAIREGKRSFREVGVHSAYCGRPADASAKEGERLLGVLVGMVLAEIG